MMTAMKAALTILATFAAITAGIALMIMVTVAVGAHP
jgi:hypothetical protein